MRRLERAHAFVCILVLACASGCASPRTATTEDHIEAVATVHAVDAQRGLIAFETAAGERAVAVVGPEVKNLVEVKPGDRLKVRYTRAVAAQVVKSSEPRVLSRSENTASETRPGVRPSAVATTETKALFRVDAIDTAANSVLVTGPDGMQQVVHVREPRMREYIRTLAAGDTVEVTYREATAISIEP